MANMTVLAFDPGGTTGWSAYKVDKILDPDGQPEYYGGSWMHGTLGPDDHHLQLVELVELQRTEIFHLVTESFEFRQGKQRAGIELISKEYIGVLKLWAEKNDVLLHQQTAALGKGFVNDPKLKALNLWSSSKHSRDASRHAIFYMVNRLHMTHLVDAWRNM